MDLDAKNVVITGGSQGLGEALAETFARAGATVLVVARSETKLAAVAERIGGRYLVADLTDADRVDRLVDRCIELLGHIDVFVNNAGVETQQAFVELDAEAVRTLARLNFEAPLMLTRAVARHMLGRGGGHIVAMSSVAGVIPFPGLAAYSGSKAGLTNFTETVRLELAGTDVNFTVVAPGPVQTPMWDNIETADAPYMVGPLKRFKTLGFLPKLSPTQVAAATVDAVRKNKRFVRLPRRYAMYHLFNNAPRRLIEGALFGVDLPVDLGASEAAGRRAGPQPDLIWPTDNHLSTKWPLITRGNVGEVFPEVVLPLTWSTFGQAAEDGWRGAFADLGLLQPGDIPAGEAMVILSVAGGYCYINASYVRMLGVRAPGATVEVIDQQFFGESDAPAYLSRPGDKSVKASLALGRTVVRLLRTTELPELEADKERVRTYEQAHPGDEADDQALLAHIRALTPLFEHLFRRHINNTFSVALMLGALQDLCVKVDEADALVSLLGGIGDVESSAPSAAMWDLAQGAKASKAISAEFDAGVAGLLERLGAVVSGPGWLAEFDRFISEFGSRGPNEWDIGSDPWELRPELALAAIDRIRNAPADHAPAHQAKRLAASRARAVDRVRAKLNPVDRAMFDKVLRSTTLYSQGRERSKTTVIRAIHSARMAQVELARRIAARGGPTVRRHTCLVDIDDFAEMVTDPAPFAEVVAERAELYNVLADRIPPFIIDGQVPALETWALRGGPTEALDAGATIQGIAGCPGTAQGRARVVLDPGDPGALEPGDVLIAPITDPSWTPLFLAASGVVVNVGATMSHAVIVSRELGIPCVVSAVGATETIPDGALIELDGNTGEVTIIELPA